MQRSSYGERDYAFGQAMVRLRTSIGLTQAGLAELLGISRKAVSHWEVGDSYPKASHLQALLAYAVGQRTWETGQAEEEIRAFWRVARQKVPLDERWLQEVLARPARQTKRAGEPSDGLGQDSAAASQELALWTVPYARNPHFTGRDELLSTLAAQLAPPEPGQPGALRRAALTQAQVIKGLGGIGKTQTAVEYAYRARAQGRFVHTLWIAAATEEALLASFASLAELLPDVATSGERESRKLVAAVLRWLEQCPQPWLLLVDNADDLSLVQPYLPLTGNGSILLTTRASAVGWLAPPLEVDTMGVMEGTELLLRRAQRFAQASEEEINEAANLVVALAQFPLALDQAGAYLEETGCSLSDYRELYQTHRHALLSRRGRQATGYPHSVATTWSLSFHSVEQRNPAAADLLRLCAFLAPDGIPEELLAQGAEQWPPALHQAVADRFRFNQVLEPLLAFSLIKRLAEERLLSVHRLVQAVQVERLEAVEQRQWAERIVRAMAVAFPQKPEETASWPQCSRYLDQVQSCDTLIGHYHLALPEAADLLTRAGIYLRGRALYSLAEPLLLRALSLREQLLGETHPDMADSLTELALLYQERGRYAEAEPLYRRAIAIGEKTLGPAHPVLAARLNTLAHLCFRQGRYFEAEQLLLRALHMREQLLGHPHPNVAESLHDLALLYWEQGKPAEAEPLFLRALSIWEAQPGPWHPRVAHSLHNLASLYWGQGKYAGAEPLFRRALRIWQEHMGPEYHDAAFPLLGLAGVAGAAGNAEEAERLARQALRLWEEQLGPEHPDVAYGLWGLALISTQQGRASQAEALFARALSLRERHLGELHLRTAQVLHDFAGFQHGQGRAREAAVLYQRALTTRERLLGPENPLTLDTRQRLQAVLGELEQTEEATHLQAMHETWPDEP